MLLLFVVGDMVGGGIYALVGEVGGRVGGALWSGFALALLLALFTAGSYAELATKYPKAGGAALYVHRAFGVPFVTFLLGFAVMMSSITSAAALSRAFGGDYLSEFVDLPVIITGLVVVALIAAINFRGIGESVKVNVACTIVELLGLLLVIAIGVAFVSGGDGDPGRAFEFKEGSDSIPFLVLAGASLAFYALIGFEDSVNLAEEAQEPSRAYPRAIFGGLAIGGVIYVSVAIIASMSVPTDKLADSDGPLLEVVQLGPLAVDTKLFAAIALFSLANTILINLITASRLLYGMGQEGVVPGDLPQGQPEAPHAGGGDPVLDRRGDGADPHRRPRVARRHDGDAAADRVHRRQPRGARQPPRRRRPRPLPGAELDPGDRRDRVRRAAHPARGRDLAARRDPARDRARALRDQRRRDPPGGQVASGG